MSLINNKNSRRGFTLIELLVVIAIIALLLAILTPALSRAKEKVKLLICTSYVKQIILAEMLYADDNDGRVPPVVFRLMYTHYLEVPLSYWPGFSSGQWVPTSWRDALDKYIHDAQRGQADYRMVCPNFKRMHSGILPWGLDGTPYGQNSWMDNDGDGVITAKGTNTPDLFGGKPLDLATVLHPSELLFISESHFDPSRYKTAWSLGGPAEPVISFPELRHPDGFPAGFLDGHAKSYGKKEHDNTTGTGHPGWGYPEPLYWPDVPDNWWHIH